MTPLSTIRDCGPLVVTGQQAGLFGGPLYTLWKTLAAVARARTLGGTAVFWIECDDADIREVDKVTLADGEGTLHRATLGMSDDNRPVATRVLPPAVTETIATMATLFPPGEQSTLAFADLSAAYQPGVPWHHAFARYLSTLLAKYDVAFLDPSSTEVKEAAAPLFARVIDAPEAILAKLIEGAALVNPPQVTPLPGELPMFVLDEEGVRRKLERRGAEFGLKGQSDSLTAAALHELLARAPERFSAAVLLRPVLQDALLDTQVYIAGPAEIRYHAQLAPLYRLLGVRQPEVVARPHVTLLEPRARRALTKLGATVGDAAQGAEALARAAARRHSGIAPGAEALAVLGRVQSDLAALSERWRPLGEATLAPAFAEAGNKIAHQINRLAARAQALQARSDEETLAQARRVAGWLAPDGLPQERVFAPIQFFARVDANEILDTVLAAIDPREQGQHLDIEIGGGAAPTATATGLA